MTKMFILCLCFLFVVGSTHGELQEREAFVAGGQQGGKPNPPPNNGTLPPNGTDGGKGPGTDGGKGPGNAGGKHPGHNGTDIHRPSAGKQNETGHGHAGNQTTLPPPHNGTFPASNHTDGKGHGHHRSSTATPTRPAFNGTDLPRVNGSEPGKGHGKGKGADRTAFVMDASPDSAVSQASVGFLHIIFALLVSTMLFY